MTQAPYMQLYVGDYLADTLHLTTEQHGAYLLILMTMWRNGAALPNDPAKLARIARVSPKRWPAIWDEIAPFFEVDGDTIQQARLTKEFKKAVSISQERKTAGKIGGKANALKRQEATQANATDLLKHAGALPEPESYKRVGGGSAHAREAENPTVETQPIQDPRKPSLRERILTAIGVDPISGLTGPGGRMIGTMADMAEVGRWRVMGLTEAEIIGVVAEVMATKTDGPPSTFKFFEKPMARLRDAKAAPVPEPIPFPSPSAPKGTRHDDRAYHAAMDALADGLSAGTVRLDTASRDPFAVRRG